MRTFIYCLLFTTLCPLVHSADPQLLDHEKKESGKSSQLSEQSVWLYHPKELTSAPSRQSILENVQKIGENGALIVIEADNYVYDKSLSWQEAIAVIAKHDIVKANEHAAIYRGSTATISFLQALPKSESFAALIDSSTSSETKLSVGDWHACSLPIKWMKQEAESSELKRLTDMIPASSSLAPEPYQLSLLTHPSSPSVASSVLTPIASKSAAPSPFTLPSPLMKEDDGDEEFIHIVEEEQRELSASSGSSGSSDSSTSSTPSVSTSQSSGGEVGRSQSRGLFGFGGVLGFL